MRNKYIKLGVFALVSLLGIGCSSGYYTMYVPDQVAAINGRFVPVARLMRNEFFNYNVPQENTPLRFQIIKPGDFDPAIAIGSETAARTSSNGYAGVSIPTLYKPCYNKPGKYILQVSLQDSEEGEEVDQRVRAYLWNTKTPVVIVDMDILPFYAGDDSKQAVKAIQQISKTANIVYFTRIQLPNQSENHALLRSLGYPDGPILLWELKHWKTGKIGTIVEMPTIYIDEHLVNQIPQLRKQFPYVQLGITSDEVAAKAFTGAGLKALLVNPQSSLFDKNYISRYSWADLYKRIPPECKKGKINPAPKPQPKPPVVKPKPAPRLQPKPVVKPKSKPKPASIDDNLKGGNDGSDDSKPKAKPVPIKISD